MLEQERIRFEEKQELLRYQMKQRDQEIRKYEESFGASEAIDESQRSEEIADENYQEPITPIPKKMAAPKSKKINIVPLK